MQSSSVYVSKQPDHQGFIHYSLEEHETWQLLYNRQYDCLHDRACPQFIEGLELLNMGAAQIPQIPELNQRLSKLTGWQVQPVPALIGFKDFFELLANKKFPAATFIRRPEHIDYIQEPDIFHEFFGHCPLLTQCDYADFSQKYGELGLKANKQQRAMLARLYWFTIEFGLINTEQGLRIYGGGILSSPQECRYSLESEKPNRQPLNVLDAMRTHYRIDQLQRNYFVIEHLQQLSSLSELNLIELAENAIKLGMYPSPYTAKENAAC